MPQGPPARTVGARLREAREKRGVSLRQIANSTRISVMSLEALERSDLSRLPGGIFTRAFIRAYAQEVGLDPDRTIQDFIAELPPEAATATAHPAAVEDGEKLESDRKAVATAIRLALVSLPIIGLVIYYGTHRAPAAPGRAVAPAAAPHAAPAETPSTTPTPPVEVPPPPPEAAAPAAVPAQTSGLSMEIAPRATCWVSVNTDGEQVFSGLMNAGDKRVVTAKEQIALNVGDAGAFVYTINGRAGKPLGAPGEVVSTRITLSNLQDFLTP
ncbi:MAG TPA: helix-turn-helix domain-containing protein [Vicinamibacterales bacterium]|nr:helix-turn-helix domain-containing protein [Vicinamibacterales bacterium]